MANFPWSGRVGRCTPCCVVCGDSEGSFIFSSSSLRCTQCSYKDIPQPHLLEAAKKEYEKRAREWCKENGIDYDEEIKKGENQLK